MQVLPNAERDDQEYMREAMDESKEVQLVLFMYRKKLQAVRAAVGHVVRRPPSPLSGCISQIEASLLSHGVPALHRSLISMSASSSNRPKR